MSLRTLSFRTALGPGCLLVATIFLGSFGFSCPGWSQDGSAPKSAAKSKTGSSRRTQPEPARVSLEKAREQAALLHEVYEATLETVHQRYFHGDRATVPARAMEDIFATMQRKHGYEGRWISVSFPPMSIDHEPETPFEKEASVRILKDEPFYETVEGGFYRRAGAISLTGGCVTCHQGSLKPPGPGKKYAGLILSIPVFPEQEGQ